MASERARTSAARQKRLRTVFQLPSAVRSVRRPAVRYSRREEAPTVSLRANKKNGFLLRWGLRVMVIKPA